MPNDVPIDIVPADPSVPVETADAHVYAVTDEGGKAIAVEAVKAEPTFTLSKFAGEAQIELSYDLVATADANSEPGKIVYTGTDKRVRFYPVKNGFELDLVLDSLPASNRFDFALSGSDGLVFNKQPEAGENFALISGDAFSWTDTEVRNKAGDVIASRQDNAPGSLAIYHSKKNGKYGTGKIGHIPRPKAIDAKNVEQWCGLEYNAGVLTVVVPQDFLDNAAYPVVIDPTLGYTTVGSTAALLGAYLFGNHYQMTEDGTATAFHLWATTNNVSGYKFTGGIYDSTGTSSSGLSQVGITAETSVATSVNGSGNAVDNSGAITGSLVNASYYLLIVEMFPQDANIQVYYDLANVTFPSSYEIYTYTAGSMPNPMDTLTDSPNAEISMYIDYTATGGPAPISASAAFVAPAAVFEANATTSVPVFTASAAFVAPAAEFNATASTGAAPSPISASAAFVAPAAVFAAEAITNAPPTVDAGPNQTIDLPTLTATMDGTVTDDGKPNPPGAVTATWTKISGPGTVVFTDDNDPDTLATFGSAGVYRLQLEADDGQIAVTDTVRIWIRDPSASGGHRSKTGRDVDGFGYGFNYGY